jgi:hypothetical protein
VENFGKQEQEQEEEALIFTKQEQEQEVGRKNSRYIPRSNTGIDFLFQSLMSTSFSGAIKFDYHRFWITSISTTPFQI